MKLNNKNSLKHEFFKRNVGKFSNKHNFLGLILGFFVPYTYSQIDVTNQIDFLKTGKIFTNEWQFIISNELTIREFFDGKIIRISRVTTDGYPYIAYSKTINEGLISHGTIYMDKKFAKIDFGKQIKNKT